MHIPGSNNGQSGFGMARGAMFPSNMNGPFGFQKFPMPIAIQHPTGVVDRPYLGSAFGKTYELTPGGYTTEEPWGFENKAFGKRKRQSRKKQSRKRQSRKRQSRKKQSRKRQSRKRQSRKTKYT